jgi:hypothetical protein
MVGGGEFLADDADDFAGAPAEEQQQKPAIGDEQAEESAAEIEAEGVFEEDDGDTAEAALARGVAHDGAEAGAIEALIHTEPVTEQHPDERSEAEQQGFDGDGEFELFFERQVDTGEVGGLEGESRKGDVRDAEQNACFPVVPAVQMGLRG